MIDVVTVDGGASGCRFAAYNVDGQLQARLAVDAHASLTLGVDEAWEHIEHGLQQLASELGEAVHWRPPLLSMGLAGALQQQKRDVFLALVPAGVQAILNTDGYAQLLGATNGQPGICLAVGTGSVLHWLDEQGNTGMAGGWGFPVADQGSGAWLGMLLLQRYVAHKDGHFCDSSMMPLLEQRVGTSVSEVQKWTTQTRSTEFATLAPLIFEAASAADPFAQALLDDAIAQCMHLISLAPLQLPVFVVGGIGDQLLPMLRAELGERLRVAKGDALSGLLHLAHTTRHTQTTGDR